MRRALIGLTAVAVTAASAAVALGAIPGSNGTISACYDKALGYVRVYDAEDGARGCTRLERPLSWNQAGPAGPQGLQGPPGAQGPSGVFSGTFTSPNGHFSISVTDDGIVLAGRGGSVAISDTGVTVEGDDTLTLRGDTDVNVVSDEAVSIRAGTTVEVEGTAGVNVTSSGDVTIKGSKIGQN